MAKKKDPMQKKSTTRNIQQEKDFIIASCQKAMEYQAQRLAEYMARQNEQFYQEYLKRVIIIEKILMEKLGVTPEELESRLASYEDYLNGMEEVNEVQEGDVVRFGLRTKEKGGEYGSQLKRATIGVMQEPLGFPEEVEKQLLELKKGEVKEIPYKTTVTEKKQDGSEEQVEKEITYEFTVDRISRKKQQEEEKVADLNKKKEQKNGQ